MPVRELDGGSKNPGLVGLDRLEKRPQDSPRTLMEPVLRIPLFHKIMLANLGLLSLGILGGVLVIPRVAPSGEGLATGLLATLLLFAATAVNLLLVRAALKPIRSLQTAALLVEAGNETARADASPVSDRQIAGLVRVFNRMLDHQEALRLSERDRAGRALKRMDEGNTRSSSELYDNLAQTLAGVLLRLRLLNRSLALHTPDSEASEAEAPVILEEVRVQIHHALEEARGIARRLHPPELYELGLGFALDALGRSLSNDTGLEIVVQAEHSLPPIPDDTRLAVFRIAEEALRNAADHAKAKAVRMKLTLETDMACLEICDDGMGFDTGAAIRGKTGLGLAAMMERATQVGGSVDIESRLGRGTCIRVRVPVAANDGFVHEALAPASMSPTSETHR